jgi:hypothetical protein
MSPVCGSEAYTPARPFLGPLESTPHHFGIDTVGLPLTGGLMFTLRRLLSVFSLCLSVGCISGHSGQTASTVGKGNMKAGLSVGRVTVDGAGSIPLIEMGARYGASDRLDIAFGAGTTSLLLGGKYQLTDPGAEGVVVSVAPTLNIWPGLLNRFQQYQLPVLIGVPVGAHELTVGPRIHHWRWTFLDEDIAQVKFTSVGTSVGFALRVGKAITLIPELAVLVPVSQQSQVQLSLLGEDISVSNTQSTGSNFLMLPMFTLQFGNTNTETSPSND